MDSPRASELQTLRRRNPARRRARRRYVVDGLTAKENGMRSRTDRTYCILAFSAVAIMLCPRGASADPVSINGFLDGQLRGAQVEEQLTLVFPDFTVVLPDATHLI